jgi:hypothetical protein
MSRNTFLKFRVTQEELDLFDQKAKELGVTVSQLIREATLFGSVKVSIAKSEAGFEFRRLGALLKHLYPARDERWTSEEKKQWWALIQDLRGKADRLEIVANGAKDEHVKMK